MIWTALSYRRYAVFPPEPSTSSQFKRRKEILNEILSLSWKILIIFQICSSLCEEAKFNSPIPRIDRVRPKFFLTNRVRVMACRQYPAKSSHGWIMQRFFGYALRHAIHLTTHLYIFWYILFIRCSTCSLALYKPRRHWKILTG